MLLPFLHLLGLLVAAIIFGLVGVYFAITEKREKRPRAGGHASR